MGFLHAGDLHFVLYRLPEGYGGTPPDKFKVGGYRFQNLVKVIIKGGRIDPEPSYGVVVRKGGKVEAYVIIVLHRHAVRFQLVETVLRFRIPAGRKFTYIPVHIVHCDQEVGKYYGIVFHISPPYVQEPGNLVEGCQEYGVAAALHQFLSQPGYLMFAGPSHLFLSKGYDGRLRRGRTVLPDEVRKVRDVDDVELPVKAVNERHFLAESVNRYRGSLFRGRETGGQPLRDKDLVRDAGLV